MVRYQVLHCKFDTNIKLTKEASSKESVSVNHTSHIVSFENKLETRQRFKSIPLYFYNRGGSETETVYMRSDEIQNDLDLLNPVF
jgi:hypothetical protein